MFQKVLIAEDFDFVSSGVKAEISKLDIAQIEYVQYCDEALLKLKRAKLDGVPFDLLISDLSFENDYRGQKITSGDDLIKEVRKEFPDLKVIVFSVEDKPYRIQTLVKEQKINAYVWKSRDGIRELKQAINNCYEQDSFYISPKLASTISTNQLVEITDYDVFLLKHLSQGYSQDQISAKLKENNYTPTSISAIEKRLRLLKEYFNANNPTHLVSISKDIGLI